MSTLSGQGKKTGILGFKQRTVRRMISHKSPRRPADINGGREVFQSLVKKPLKSTIRDSSLLLECGWLLPET